MKQIRIGVFETNSSSTHSLTVLSKEDYDKWVTGKVYVSLKDEVYYSKEEIEKEFSDQITKWYDGNVDDFIAGEFLTYQKHLNTDMETFETKYTTKNGDEIMIFGKYGYNG
jgi:hypothetical protein